MALKDELKMRLWGQKYRQVSLEEIHADIYNQVVHYFKKNDRFAKIYSESIDKNLKKWKLYQDDMYRDPKDVYDSFINQVAYFYYERYINLNGAVEDVVDLISPKTIIFQQNWKDELAKRLLDRKGLIFVTGHYGAYEILPIILSYYGFDTSVVIDFDFPQIPQIFKTRFSIMGPESGSINFIDPKDPDVFNKARLALTDNQTVLVFCDEFSLWKPTQEIYQERVNFIGKEIQIDTFIDGLGAPTVFGILRRIALDPTRRSRYLMKLVYDLGRAPQNRALEFLSAEILRNPEQYMYWDRFDGKNVNEMDQVKETPKTQGPKQKQRKQPKVEPKVEAILRGGSYARKK
jgi:hypothetical protein